jgi:O-antigen/teichoic acid export membrane protein
MGEKLAKFGLLQLLGKFIPGIIGFLVAAVLTRLLTPDEYGVYGLAMALAQFGALSAFGWLGLSVTRLATGRVAGRRFELSVLAVFAAIAVIAAALAQAGFLFGVGSRHMQVINAVIFGGTVFGFFEIKSAFYTATFRFFPLFLFNLTRAAISAAAATAIAFSGGGGIAVFLGYCAAMWVVCLLFRSKHVRQEAFAIDLAVVRRVFAFGLPIAGSLILFAISGWTDRIVLNALSGAAAVGFYTAAMIIVQNTLQMAASAIASAAYPLAVVAYDSGDRLAVDRQLKQNFTALFGFMVPAATGLWLLGPSIAAVLVGKEYREAVISLTPLLAISAVLYAARGNFIDHAFQLTGKTHYFVPISAATAAVNLAALALLVPRYGYMGAGIASIITAVAGLLYALVQSRSVYPLTFPLPEIAKIIVADLAMAVALSSIIHLRGAAALCAQVAIGMFVYLIAALSLNLLNLRQSAMTAVLRWRTAR